MVGPAIADAPLADQGRSKTDGSERGQTGAVSPKPAARGTDSERTRRNIRLGYLIHDVSRMRRTAFDQMAKSIGVTRAQWWVLAYLARRDGMSQIELAAALDLTKASLGTLLDRLEATGFIVRKPDGADRRVKRVFLTGKSRRLLQKLLKLEQRFNEIILRDLSDQEVDDLVRILSLVKAALKEISR